MTWSSLRIILWRGCLDGVVLDYEKVCIDTIESGYMTKDLALLVSSDQPWLSTQEFLEKIGQNFKNKMRN